MKRTNEPQVIAAECAQGGIFISFDDGNNAFYPGHLLRAALDLAAIMHEHTQPETVPSTSVPSLTSSYS